MQYVTLVTCDRSCDDARNLVRDLKPEDIYDWLEDSQSPKKSTGTTIPLEGVLPLVGIPWNLTDYCRNARTMSAGYCHWMAIINPSRVFCARTLLCNR
jgi:hypothetical protein